MMEIGFCYEVEQCISLDQLQKGDQLILIGFAGNCSHALKKCFLEHGFIKGSRISIYAISPLGDPVAYKIRRSVVVLRKDEAKYLKGVVL